MTIFAHSHHLLGAKCVKVKSLKMTVKALLEKLKGHYFKRTLSALGIFLLA